jgi:hypothetical protein
MLSGCETPELPESKSPDEFMQDELGFIQDGLITREEVVMRLGMPSATFENERIILYPFVVDRTGNWSIGGARFIGTSPLRAWEPTTCNLVLVFTEDGLLERHKLVLPNAFIKKEAETPQAP